MKQITKIDNNTVQIEEQVTVPVQIITRAYTYEALLAQRQGLQDERDAIDLKLKDLDSVITEADALGITLISQ